MPGVDEAAELRQMASRYRSSSHWKAPKRGAARKRAQEMGAEAEQDTVLPLLDEHFPCFDCGGTDIVRRGPLYILQISPYTGTVECRDCGYKESVVGYLRNHMIHFRRPGLLTRAWRWIKRLFGWRPGLPGPHTARRVPEE